MAYMVMTPQKFEKMLDHPTLGKALAMSGYTNYIFPTTPEGLNDAAEIDQRISSGQEEQEVLHVPPSWKFIRDATPQELENAVKRICQMATGMKVSMGISVPAVAPVQYMQT